VYVTNYDANTVSVINTSTNTVSATIPVGSYPYGVSVSPDGSKVYIANYGGGTGNTVSVISTASNTVTATIPVSAGPVAFGNFISSFTVGIAQQSIVSANIAVYPNPNNGKFQVLSPKSQIQSVEVYNMIGEEVFTTTNNKLQTTNEINISSFPAGMYVVEVKTEKGVEVKKFVRE
jgi:YVTN family beta-propeller protein